MTLIAPTVVRTLQPGEPYHWLGTPHPLQIVDDHTAAPVVLERAGDDQVPLKLARRHATAETLQDWYVSRSAPYAARVVRTFAARAQIQARPLQFVDRLEADALVHVDRGTILVHWALCQLPADVVDALLARAVAHAHSLSNGGRPPWCTLLDQYLPDWGTRDLRAEKTFPAWRGDVDGTLVPPVRDLMQPVPQPDTPAAAAELARTGVLVDLAGRPLTAHTCRWCDEEHLSGVVCPIAITCPHCDSPAGRRQCLRPSGQDAPELHSLRRWAAERIAQRRADAGDTYVPAPWPHAVQTELFELDAL